MRRYLIAAIPTLCLLLGGCVRMQPAEIAVTPRETEPAAAYTYVINTSSRKFHLPDCTGAAKIKESNRRNSAASREELILHGYDPCGICEP